MIKNLHWTTAFWWLIWGVLFPARKDVHGRLLSDQPSPVTFGNSVHESSVCIPGHLFLGTHYKWQGASCASPPGPPNSAFSCRTLANDIHHDRESHSRSFSMENHTLLFSLTGSHLSGACIHFKAMYVWSLNMLENPHLSQAGWTWSLSRFANWTPWGEEDYHLVSVWIAQRITEVDCEVCGPRILFHKEP